jgi:HD-GYP domain-containing protein (c-di-GMP phosphodiesterase class II)
VIDSYDSPDAQALLEAREEKLGRQQRRPRELLTNGIGAGLLLVAVGLLAALAPWHRSLTISNLLLVLIVWLVIERVRFPVAHGWAYATMLVFVPALFLLPTPVVPLVATTAVLLGAVPDFIGGRVPLALLPAVMLGGWFAVGPALVIIVAGASHFAWSNWPVYVAALVAQLGFDLASSIAWSCIADRISIRTLLPRLTWVYAVDVTLFPLGLAIAAVAVGRPGLVVIALSPVALLALFARERQRRLDAMLELSTAYRGTTLLLGDIVEADDHYTGVHSRQVVDLSLGVADMLGLDATHRRNVEFGALLHDVGKIRVPKDILNKPGALGPNEWELVRRHTVEGEAMVRQVGGKLAALAPIIRASHERWDGRGYPDGLAGYQIPIEARIIAACDAYNAMTTDRPYRAALGSIEARAELRRGSGSQFDPQVIAALDRLIGAELEVADHPEVDRAEAQFAAFAVGRRPSRRGYTAVSARL